MANNSKNKGMGSFKAFAFILPLLFFIGIALVDGPVWCVDSQSYVSMDFSREPVYPLFLALFRNLFLRLGFVGTLYGQPSYFVPVILVQSMLWVYASYRLGVAIFTQALKRGTKYSIAYALGAIAVVLQIAVAGLNRFAANRGSMYSECIMTESLAMPLFVLFTVTLWELYLSFDMGRFVKVFALAVLIASVRKQMLVALLTWMATAFILYVCVKKSRNVKRFLLTLIFGVTAFIMIGVIDRTYNYYQRGMFVEHTGNSIGAIDTLIYTMDPEDEALFAIEAEKHVDAKEYPELATLYNWIIYDCRDNGYNIKNAEGVSDVATLSMFKSDWVSIASHYAEVYDHIGFDIAIPRCDQYVAKYFPELSGNEALKKSSDVAAEFMKTCMRVKIAKLFRGNKTGAMFVFCANVTKAFVISNANISPRSLIIVSLIMYALFIAAFILMCVKKNNSFTIFALVVFVGLAINCVVTGSLIFPQPRYMCYSMGLFYLTLSCGILSR